MFEIKFHNKLFRKFREDGNTFFRAVAIFLFEMIIVNE
jgi:hypothetical protein